MNTILIIEDEVELAEIVKSYLERAGYNVLLSAEGKEGLKLAKQKQPSLIILDLNLPGMDGMDIARELRRDSDIPIIMATARVEETDRLVGLEMGADDYLIKPYSPRELTARVKAVLRRVSVSGEKGTVFHLGPFTMDNEQHHFHKNGEEIELTPTEYAMLGAMLSQPGRVFSRMQLLEAAQGSAYEGYERTVDAHIKNIRQKIEEEPRKPQWLETVFGVGYRLRKPE